MKPFPSVSPPTVLFSSLFLPRFTVRIWDYMDHSTCKGITASHLWGWTLQDCSPRGSRAVVAIFWAVKNLKRNFVYQRLCFPMVTAASRPLLCARPAGMQCTKAMGRSSSSITNSAFSHKKDKECNYIWASSSLQLRVSYGCWIQNKKTRWKKTGKPKFNRLFPKYENTSMHANVKVSSKILNIRTHRDMCADINRHVQNIQWLINKYCKSY